jgi:HlyD family secretion protein
MITLAVIMLVAAFIGYNAYAKATNLNKTAPVASTYLPAFRQTLTSTVSSTGTVAATQQVSLNFDIGQGTGKILKFFVGLGDKVTTGQPLAKLDDQDLVKTLASSQSNLAAAQARLNAITNPAVADVAAADQAIASASSQVTTAQNNLDKLQHPLPADLAAAQQSITQAQGSLIQAQNAITTAQNTLQQAQNDLVTANISLNSSYTSVLTSWNTAIVSCSLFGLVPPRPFLGSLATLATPVSPLVLSPQNPYNPLNLVTTTPSPGSANSGVTSAGCQTALNGYNGSANSYNSALATQQKADSSAKSASQAVTNGNLQSGVSSAQATLQTANEKALALANPTLNDLNGAADTLTSAQAGLKSAQARRQALSRPTPDQVLPLQATVDQGTAQVSTAQKNLDAATITAPFDGVVSQVNGDVGTLVTASTVVFILLNPTGVRIDANVDQVDINNLKVGQTAAVTFDALQGRSYQAVIAAIGLTPTIQQGVVTYNVTLSVDTSRLAPGVPVPAPGMTAAIQVTTSRTDNALVVPNRAIRRVGARATVSVKKPDGTDEVRQVTTGATNGTLTAITNGLQDGEEVLISSATTARSTGALPGGIQVPAAPGGR